jgi:selenocysteine lyase/cysteine desulfurase
MLHGSDVVAGLNHIEGVKVFFDQEDLVSRDLIVAIAIDGLDCTQAVREYEKQGVIVYERIGSSLYSGRMLEACGLQGLIRVTPIHCNTIDEVDRFLVITAKIAKKFAGTV